MRGYLPSGERLSAEVPPLIPGVSQFRNSNGEVDLSLCMADPTPKEKRERKPAKKRAAKKVTIEVPRKRTRRGKRKPKAARL